MSTKTTDTRRLIYMVQTRDHAIHQGIYSAVIYLIGAISLALHAPIFIFYMFCVVGSYFLLGSAINTLAYIRKRKAKQQQEDMPISTNEDQIENDDIVQEIDLGNHGETIRLIYSNSVLASNKDCVEKVRSSIANDKERFVQRFAAFREENMKKYPKYAHFISELSIQSVRIFRSKGKCIAYVRFVGEVGDVWSARYTGESFSELIWV